MRKDFSRRVISVFLPNWPTDRLRRKQPDLAHDKPLVTVATDGQRRVLVSVDIASRRAGLSEGMALTHARALVPDLHHVAATPDDDVSDLKKLASWMLTRFSPVVSMDHPNGVLIDASGCAHLFGGEDRIMQELSARVTKTGFTVRAAMASTVGAANALARFAANPMVVLPHGKEAEALAPLPVDALRIEGLSARLSKVGIERIGQLYELPRAPLARRYGEELLKRLDQALGRAPTAVDPLIPKTLISTRVNFVEPISTPEHLDTAIREVASQLCTKLSAKGFGARRLDLLFHRIDGVVSAVRVGTTAASHDQRHLARLLSERLVEVDPGLGVEAMTLTASITQPFKETQRLNALVPEHHHGDVARLVDTLANRLGFDRIYRMEPVESDVPERSQRTRAALSPPSEKPWPAEWPRPSRFLSKPEPIETIALLPDCPPGHFVWRGKRHRVTRADGPERIYGEWWKSDAEVDAVRDYFQVEDETGARFWLYRIGHGIEPTDGPVRWFIQGFFT